MDDNKEITEEQFYAMMESTGTTAEDFDTAVKDMYGVLYSPDGKKLIRFTDPKVTDYMVQPGTEIICAEAFIIFDGNMENCNRVERVTIPPSVKLIGGGAFSGCKCLKYVNIPPDLHLLGWGAFRACYNLEIDSQDPELVFENKMLIDRKNKMLLAYLGTDSVFTVPDEIEIIDDYVFFNCKFLTEVTLPENVRVVGNHAFSLCDHLVNIHLGNSLKYLGNNSFELCSKLESIVIPDTVTVIGAEAFSHCDALKNITWSKNLEFISCNAFYACDSLETLELPPTVKEIGDEAFQGSWHLSEVILPQGLEYLGAKAFAFCSQLSHVVLPESLNEIGGGVFAGCVSALNVESRSPRFMVENNMLIDYATYTLVSYWDIASQWITLPDIIQNIAPYACLGLVNVETLNLPSGLSSIAEDAFEDCDNIERIVVPFDCLDTVRPLLPEAMRDKVVGE